MEISIKINTATMVRNLLCKTIDDVKRMYKDDMFWAAMSNTESKRRLAIANMDKFEHWVHDLSDEEIVKLMYKPGVLSMLDKFRHITLMIIHSENESWVWKPRYILSLMILISYVVEYDWCNLHHVGVMTRGILRHKPDIRVGEYLKTIQTSEAHRKKIREIFNSIVHI